jgi:type IV pilus assembly protein PilV
MARQRGRGGRAMQNYLNAMRGFALIEVLMATLVLALALTGLLQMQLVALRAQQQNAYQSSAARLATEMAEMIRVYGATSQGGAATFLLDYHDDDDNTLPAAPGCDRGDRCSPAALRASSIALWLQTLQEELPHARVRICRDAAPYNIAAQDYRWACQSGAGAGIVIKLGWRVRFDSSAMQMHPDHPLLVFGLGELPP